MSSGVVGCRDGTGQYVKTVHHILVLRLGPQDLSIPLIPFLLNSDFGIRQYSHVVTGGWIFYQKSILSSGVVGCRDGTGQYVEVVHHISVLRLGPQDLSIPLIPFSLNSDFRI